MTAAGRAAFARRREERSRTYAYEQSRTASLDAHELAEFRRHATAWAFFERQAPSYRRRALWFVVSAKRAETRQRRLASLIAASAQGTPVVTPRSPRTARPANAQYRCGKQT